MTIKINYKRMMDNFLELVKIESPSNEELNMQLYAQKKLKSLGCKVTVDNAGKTFPTNAKGNVIGFLPGTIKSEPFVLAGHLDTVKPCKNIKPVIKGNKVTSSGKTILGADDRAGLAIIFEVLNVLKENKIPHPPISVLFTLCEENGMYGAKGLDITKLKGREGIILDSSDNDKLTVSAPEANTIDVEITGFAAHAGVEPEKGISALEVAAYALSIMQLGRIDKLTVANFGVVNGGESTNVVMPSLFLKGEVRSRNLASLKKQIKHMQDCFVKAQKKFTKKVNGKMVKPVIDFKVGLKYPILDIAVNSPLIKHITAEAKKHGVKIKPYSSGGGYDANILSGKGLLTPIIGVGYRQMHTLNEWLDIKMFNQTADIILDIVLNYKK
ncbi:Peptidase M20 [Elusimicrobium minutum Pei191]|uniref:Peptidase M20 n=1 Tax=Elusimicrobium minutum (strain Pei191) TaxID=445932 RepID=B2KD75_ELUMP|nr:M20/M25/M40 family metallo-hydrolase [Elusimicrobium minutum]ACC98471.1 Peptidase M20 [Elusimicrobium minutum Pei191]